MRCLYSITIYQADFIWLVIDLMSGSNNNMSLVTNVVNGLDGTDESLSPFSWTCPEVDPYSTIYFYQFTNGDDISTRAWTTRFTVGLHHVILAFILIAYLVVGCNRSLHPQTRRNFLRIQNSQTGRACPGGSVVFSAATSRK